MNTEGFDGGSGTDVPHPQRTHQGAAGHEASGATRTGEEPGGTNPANEETHHPGFEPASDDDTGPLPIMSPTETDPEPSIDADPTEPPELTDDQEPGADEAHPLPVVSPPEAEDDESSGR